MSIMTSAPASIASPGRVSGVSPTVPLIPRSFLVPVSRSWCARTQNGISGRNSWTWYKISEARIKERSHLIISFELSRIRMILQDGKLKVFRFSHSSTFHFFPLRVTFSGRLDNFILHEWFIFLSFISLLRCVQSPLGATASSVNPAASTISPKSSETSERPCATSTIAWKTGWASLWEL